MGDHIKLGPGVNTQAAMMGGKMAVPSVKGDPFRCPWGQWAERYYLSYKPEWVGEVHYEPYARWRQNWYDIIKQGGKCRMEDQVQDVQNVEEKS